MTVLSAMAKQSVPGTVNHSVVSILIHLVVDVPLSSPRIYVIITKTVNLVWFMTVNGMVATATHSLLSEVLWVT